MSEPTENPSDRRHESDREDIMREATALRRRASFVVDGLPQPIVAGFRARDFFSVFFDQDPVYQFDNEGRLRRAYRGGLLYRTQGVTLAELTRVRTTERTELQRRDLGENELNAFIAEMHEFMTKLNGALISKSAELLEQIPADKNFAAQIVSAIDQVLSVTEPLAAAFPTRKR